MHVGPELLSRAWLQSQACAWLAVIAALALHGLGRWIAPAIYMKRWAGDVSAFEGAMRTVDLLATVPIGISAFIAVLMARAGDDADDVLHRSLPRLPIWLWRLVGFKLAVLVVAAAGSLF